MKKAVKKILLILSVIFVMLIGAGLIYYFPMFLMHPAKAGQISNRNIYVVEDFGNGLFLVKTENGYIMIDAGTDIKRIENYFQKSNKNINDVKWIFITHSDGDHLAALPLFPHANIYMNKDELQLINGTMKRIFLVGNKLPSGINIDRIIPLSNGQELIIDGTSIKCITAPGHTIGSMMYLVEDKYLFTGDAIKIKNGNMSVHPYSMNNNQSKKTIEELREIISNSQIVITSHYGIYYNN